MSVAVWLLKCSKCFLACPFAFVWWYWPNLKKSTDIDILANICDSGHFFNANTILDFNFFLINFKSVITEYQSKAHMVQNKLHIFFIFFHLVD